MNVIFNKKKPVKTWTNKLYFCESANILAFCGILNLSIISSLCWLSGKEGLELFMSGSLEIPNRAMIPLLHKARDRVTNVARLEMSALCPLAIWKIKQKNPRNL